MCMYDKPDLSIFSSNKDFLIKEFSKEKNLKKRKLLSNMITYGTYALAHMFLQDACTTPLKHNLHESTPLRHNSLHMHFQLYIPHIQHALFPYSFIFSFSARGELRKGSCLQRESQNRFCRLTPIAILPTGYIYHKIF